MELEGLRVQPRYKSANIKQSGKHLFFMNLKSAPSWNSIFTAIELCLKEIRILEKFQVGEDGWRE